MRIAICISGQIRTWRQCYESWFILFDELRESSKFSNMNIEIDFFIHTWNFNTIPPHQHKEMLDKSIDWSKVYLEIDKCEFNDVIEIFKPKKYVIEDSYVSSSRKKILNDRASRYNNTEGSVIGWAGSQLYSIMRAAQLKRDYEIENKFEYDVCVKMRFDGRFSKFNRPIFISNFNPPLNKKTIYSMHSANIYKFPFDLIGDIFFYCDSQTYDVITSFYNWIPIMKENLFSKGVRIEEVFGYFIRMFNIDNKRSTLNVEIMRTVVDDELIRSIINTIKLQRRLI
jgi:hypothetical protein